ncbi:MAG TPA: gamma-glutamyltransferase family protein [Acidimicrobiia bacterium]
MAAKRFPRGGVASPHYLASTAGLATLARGGNALDAAIAANLALGVVAPYLCGYGGDVFAIVWDGRLHGYLGSGRSPRAATIDEVRARAGTDTMPMFGPHAFTVPGAVAGWFDLLERWGTKSFGELAQGALSYARDGFELTPTGEMYITGSLTMYPDAPALHATYGGAKVGRVLDQPALARTIATLAADGPDAYYRGPIAAAIAETVQDAGGVLTTADLAAYEGRWAVPLRAQYRGVEVAELPPQTQGVTALEALRILDGVALPTDGAERQHLLIEAIKFALEDRNDYVSDPNAMTVTPDEMLSDAWIADRRSRIDPRRAATPKAGAAHVGGTAYLCAADSDGLLVSLIQSNFLSFGSGLHVREWGINLNNRGSSFMLDPTRVNALGPGKLPMHTLMPAMVMRGREPWLVFGTMGGDSQAQVQVQLLAHMVDDGVDPQDALDAPRWCIDPSSWSVRAERLFPPEWFDSMRALGHQLQSTARGDTGMGHAHAIARTPNGYAVATEPRTEGAALGF